MHRLFDYLALTVWFAMTMVALLDCLKSNNEHKLRWIAVIVLVPCFGSLCFFHFARGRYVSEL